MPSANITFDGIPSSRSTPGVYSEFNTKMAVNTLPANLYKVLVIGQRLAAGSVQANVAVDIFSDDEAAVYFGYGSIAHLTCRAAIKANRYLSLQAITLDDAAAGVAAADTVTITGPASANGAFGLDIDDQAVDIAVASGDSADAIAAALKAQIDLQPDLPVVATAALGVLTLTAKNKGTLGNGIKVSTRIKVAGVTAVTTAMSGGLNDPDISTALTAVYNAGHDILLCAFNDQTSLTALRTHIDAVSGPLEKRRCRATFGYNGTYAGATTLAATINSGRMLSCLVPGTDSPSYGVGAAMGSVAASEEDPARPLNDLPLTGIKPPPSASWLSGTQIEAALHNGVTPTHVGPGNKVQIVRSVTTYLLNANGVPDISMRDWQTIGTLDYVAAAIEQRIALRFPRDKKSVRTKARVKDEIMNVLYKLEDLEIIENVDANKAGLLLEDDAVDPDRYNTKIPVDVVNGLHVIANRLDLIL
ncbi:phage tail sheath subtilisin-like domain-containing protein [Mariprofundus ferrooxydans]|uniref:phage tail sheath subtilisin-like domain-containing protein n=1 Tax=Mariprofundus ferrooxydans TaxID=314344 RepID=UPI0006A6A515|nr:phage tail sheath subtilisin-like domain-containing protein [Mariprofundus ferrooxydans]KON47022.1 phage tail protein [Mariprofundus ferrooxydans]